MLFFLLFSLCTASFVKSAEASFFFCVEAKSSPIKLARNNLINVMIFQTYCTEGRAIKLKKNFPLDEYNVILSCRMRLHNQIYVQLKTPASVLQFAKKKKENGKENCRTLLSRRNDYFQKHEHIHCWLRLALTQITFTLMPPENGLTPALWLSPTKAFTSCRTARFFLFQPRWFKYIQLEPAEANTLKNAE